MSMCDSALTALTARRGARYLSARPATHRYLSRPTRPPDADVGFPGLTPLRADAADLGHRARIRARLRRAQAGRQYCPRGRTAHLESDQAHRSLDDAAAARPPLEALEWRCRPRRSEAGTSRPSQLSELSPRRHHRVARRCRYE